MNINVEYNGRELGGLRKLTRRLGLKALSERFSQMETWHYRCRRMEKSARYDRLADVYVYFSPFRIHIPAFQDEIAAKAKIVTEPSYGPFWWLVNTLWFLFTNILDKRWWNYYLRSHQSQSIFTEESNG